MKSTTEKRYVIIIKKPGEDFIIKPRLYESYEAAEDDINYIQAYVDITGAIIEIRECKIEV